MDFIGLMFYLLTLLLKPRNASYTTTLTTNEKTISKIRQTNKL